MTAADRLTELEALHAAAGTYDHLNLTNQFYLASVPLCLACGSLVWDLRRHEKWHAAVASALDRGTE